MPKIAFIDLTHTGLIIDANNFPLGIAYVAAATARAFGAAFDIELYKYPSELSAALERETPAVAAFSNYMWNERLQRAYAAAIKQRHPEVVTIAGGPNFPLDAAEQEAWLRGYPELDFYVDGEGELAFVELLRALAACDFDAAALKRERPELPNLRYLDRGEFVRGAMAPRIADLDAALPSPYLDGFMDRFFDGKLTPMMQTSRGCPYTCTFCHDGISYMLKTVRFSQERIDAELAYVLERVSVPAITLADLNWGMFPGDIDTARTLARMKAERGWPRNVLTATAKNQKARVIEMAAILGDSMHIGASIQSTDSEVLRNIKRSNIGFDAIVAMAKDSQRSQTTTFTEIILALPGDTEEKHKASCFAMLDAQIQDIRSYQFILLPGTEAADPTTRERYSYVTRFRVLPRCFGRYEIYGQSHPVAEIHEVCIANDTLPLEAYLECRDFDLTLQVFNNGSLIDELLRLADALGVKRSAVIGRIHAHATAPESPMRRLYDDFRADEDRNFRASAAELEAFLATDAGFEAYLTGEFGGNQIYRYRAIALVEMIDRVLALAATALRAAIAERDMSDPRIDRYIDELVALTVARRSALTETGRTFELETHFDFERIAQAGYHVDPRAYWRDRAAPLRVGHTAERRRHIDGYLRQYEPTIAGLTYFLHRNPAQVLYRDILSKTVAEQALGVG